MTLLPLCVNIHSRSINFSMKKWSKLVLATMLSAGTLLVSGCIENIEPEGIADLRGAKAELLRAQVALQAAQAAKVEADAALVLAQAKVQEAIAKQEEAKAKYEEALALKAQYEAEYQNIQNESARADLEKKIADNEIALEQARLDAELYALQLQEDMLLAEEAAVKAQQKIDQALRDLAVAKATLTPNEAAAIAKQEAEIVTARNAVETKTKALQSAAVALARALADIDDNGKSTMIADLEQAVVLAEVTVAAALEAEAEAKALLEVDKTIVDWDAEYKKLEGQLDSMTRSMIAYTEKYNEAIAEITYAMESIDEKIENYVEITGYDFDFDPSGTPDQWGTGKFVSIQNPTLIKTYLAVPDVEIKNDVIGDFKLIDGEYIYGKEEELLRYFDGAINYLKYDYEYYRHYALRGYEYEAAAVAEMEKAPEYVAAQERYADALKARKSKDFMTYYKKYEYTVENSYAADFDIAKVVTAYNEALAAFEKGIADYEAEEKRLVVDEVEYLKIQADYNAEIAKIDAEKSKGYQEAESKYQAAAMIYEKAVLANEAALEKMARAIKVAEKTADATEAEMLTFESAYVEALATDEEKAKHALYVKALEQIKKARDAYQDPDPAVKTDPESVFAAAGEKWLKDKKLYDYNGGSYDVESVYAEINASYTDKKFDIDNAYDVKLADFFAKYPNFSTQYRNEWVNRLDDLLTDLDDAITDLDDAITDVVREIDNRDDAEYSVNLYDYTGNLDVEKDLIIYSVPDYLMKDGLLVPVKLDELADPAFFEDELDDAIDNLWYYLEVEIEFNDSNVITFELYSDDTAEYPEALPKYETFVAMLETMIKSRGYTFDDIEDIDYTTSDFMEEFYMAKFEVELYKSRAEAYYDAIPAHMTAIEAAKAEFVAYVAEREAELEALKKEIEETVGGLLELIVPLYDEVMVRQAEYDIASSVKSSLASIIESYIATYHEGSTPAPETLEAFEEALMTAYNAAIAARISAEEALAEAEWAVEEAKAGNLNTVELAQMKYDRATEELAEAMAKLDKATADLQALLAVIFGEEE